MNRVPMIQNGCMHFTIGCKYAYAVCFEDISLGARMVCRECARYFRLERNVRALGVKGLWDIRKPFETPSNLCEYILRYCAEVSSVTPQWSAFD